MSSVIKETANLSPPPSNGRRIQELAMLRSKLLGIARKELRDEADAQDAVQDALAAALDGLADFRGDAKLETWIVIILKRKIFDIHRKRAGSRLRRNPELEKDDDIDDGDQCDSDSNLSETASHSDWADPVKVLSNKQFLQALEDCISRLPRAAGQVFTMREVLELETEEICRRLTISETNCGVLMHRARIALIPCLNAKMSRGKGVARGLVLGAVCGVSASSGSVWQQRPLQSGGPFMDCEQAATLISNGMEKKLGIFTRAKLFFHMRRCGQCSNLKNQLMIMRMGCHKMNAQEYDLTD